MKILAEMIRRAFVFTRIPCLGPSRRACCLGWGSTGDYAQAMAALLFVVSMSALLAGMTYYVREVNVALSSVRQEAADSRFMDFSTTQPD